MDGVGRGEAGGGTIKPLCYLSGMKSSSRHRCVCLTSMLLCATAQAQSVDALNAQQQALSDQARQLRTTADARYAAEKRPCYEEFQVNRCLDQATARHKAAMRDVDALELRAHQLKRQAQATEKADKARQDAANAPQREAQERQRVADFQAQRAERERERLAKQQADDARRAQDASYQAKSDQRAKKYADKAAQIDAKVAKKAKEKKEREERARQQAEEEAAAAAKAEAARQLAKENSLSEKFRRFVAGLLN